ncbi:hypothetical protein [Streptomyces sp. NBC_01565]|uniref:hypothetical protein n=1 Tax=Streptomyces sp. NBC_01565 TaxID=2975881 RepID=UPI0022559200|nr:hypothetical protein [Streptomyces sp. NBC_01565]MCX4541287.1 hypothetical protein [Streptomyces sp. NBC_01565]
MDVEKEVAGGLFGALSSLLAIVLAAFSAFWALHVKLAGEDESEDYMVLEARKDKHGVYRRWMWGLFCVVAALIGVLSPAFVSIVTGISVDLPFSTVRAMLVLFFLLLLGAGGAAIMLILKFSAEMERLRAEVERLKKPEKK